MSYTKLSDLFDGPVSITRGKRKPEQRPSVPTTFATRHWLLYVSLIAEPCKAIRQKALDYEEKFPAKPIPMTDHKPLFGGTRTSIVNTGMQHASNYGYCLMSRARKGKKFCGDFLNTFDQCVTASEVGFHGCHKEYASFMQCVKKCPMA